MKNIFVGLILFLIPFFASHSQVVSIAEALEDLNYDYVPDRLGDTVTVVGTVYSPRFHNVANTYFIDDGTAGTNVYMPAPPTFNWDLGDELQITGTVAHFFGLSEIIALDSASWVLISSGNPLPEPTVLTISQYLTTPEAYEGSLVGFQSLEMVDGFGFWPAPFNNAVIKLSDGIDSIDVRINRYTDVDDNPEPMWPVDIVGCAQQNTTNIPPDDGYQIMLRFYGDIMPPGTLPVELTVFTAKLMDSKVLLSWTTVSELNNQGFEIERNVNNTSWNIIGFIEGAGTTTEDQSYTYIDDIQYLSRGTVGYRLKQKDFRGSFEYSDIVEISTFANSYELSQNYPNPFNPTTTIKYAIPEKAYLSLRIFDVLGSEVRVLVKSEVDAGEYEVQFRALDLPSGVYFYRLVARSFIETKRMILVK